MSDAAGQPPGRMAIVGYVLAAAALAAVSLLICGYHPPPWINHSFQLPLIYRLQDPGLYPNDPLVDAFAKTPSWFFPAVAWLTARVALSKLFLALHCLSQLGTISALVFGALPLARRNRWAPVIAGLLFCGLTEPLAGGATLHWNGVTHTSVAAPLVLWSLAAALNGWWTAAFTLAGLATVIHPLLGIAVWVALAGATGVEWRNLRGAPARWLARSAVGVILTLAILLPALPQTLNADPGGPYWKNWLLRIFDIHYHPLRQSWPATTRLLASLALLWLLDDGTRRFRWMLGAIALWLLLGILGTEVWRSGALVLLQSARTAPLLMPLLIWALTAALCRSSERAREDRADTSAILTAIVLGGLAIHLTYYNSMRQQASSFLENYTIVYVLFTLILALLSFLTLDDRRQSTAGSPGPPFSHLLLRNLLLMLGLGPLVASGLVLISNLSPKAELWNTYLAINDLYIYAILLFILALAISGGAMALKPLRRFLDTLTRPGAWLVCLLGLQLIFLGVTVNNRQAKWRNPLIEPDMKPERVSAKWIRENTPQDALFLVYGFEYDHFRPRTRRALIYNADHYRALYLDRSFEAEILRLARELRIEGLPLYSKPQSWRLPPDGAWAAAIRLGADYLVCQPGFIKGKTPEHRDEAVEIYALTP